MKESSDSKICFKCGFQMNKPIEVCPQCRERQPLRKTRMRWIALGIAAILAWLAFRQAN